MVIDPRLYEKVTGRRPGEAMDNHGKSLAGQKAHNPDLDTSMFGSIMRGRLILRLIVAVAVLGAVLAAFLFGGRWI